MLGSSVVVMKEFSQGLLLSLSRHVRTISFLGHEKSVQRAAAYIAFLVQCVCVFVAAEDGRQRQTAGSVGYFSCRRWWVVETRLPPVRNRERERNGRRAQKRSVVRESEIGGSLSPLRTHTCSISLFLKDVRNGRGKDDDDGDDERYRPTLLLLYIPLFHTL